MDINDVILKLQIEGVIKQGIRNISALNGGTVSQLFLVHLQDESKWVIKWNEPLVTESEAAFLLTYKKNPILPQILYVEENHQFMVYSYLEGSTLYPGKNKTEILSSFVLRLLNYYKPMLDANRWGWADSPEQSWENFLLKEALGAREIIDCALATEDHHFVEELIKNRIPVTSTPYLLHGDCGFHNFIFKNEEMIGIIDPLPVLGNPLYDLVYAFCSSPDDLNKETLNEIAKHVSVGNSDKMNEQVLVGLYLRIASCIKHHPNDLSQYLNAWEYWKAIVQQEIKTC